MTPLYRALLHGDVRYVVLVYIRVIATSQVLSTNLDEFSYSEVSARTYIQKGTIPPGGMTHGSDASKLGGTIRSPLSLRSSKGIPLRIMYELTPAITPYAILLGNQSGPRLDNENLLVRKGYNDNCEKGRDSITDIVPIN